MKIDNLVVNNIKFQEKIENVINDKIFSGTFNFCQFAEEFEFSKLFHKKNVEGLNFGTSNLPTLKKETEYTFKNLKYLILNNIEEMSESGLKWVLRLSNSIQYLRIKEMKIEKIDEFFEILKEFVPKLNRLELIKIEWGLKNSTWMILTQT